MSPYDAVDGSHSPASSVPTLTFGSGFDGFEFPLGAFGFFEDGVCGCGPDEGNRVLIVDGEIVVDRLRQFGDTFEDAAADAFSGDLGEEALDQVEPGSRGRREMDVEARVFLQPPFNLRRLVDGVSRIVLVNTSVLIANDSGGFPGGRLLSRNRPSTPASR